MDPYRAMLLLHPSRVGLTQNDIDDFERRQNARPQSILPTATRAHGSRVRLNISLPGPARPTVFSNINNIAPHQSAWMNSTDEDNQLPITPQRVCFPSRAPLSEIFSAEPDASLSSRSRHSTPLLSSHRARRRNLDFELHQDSPARQQFIEERHIDPIRPFEEAEQQGFRHIQRTFPELAIPGEALQPEAPPPEFPQRRAPQHEAPRTEEVRPDFLNPGAPAFVPTTRFGEAPTTSAEAGLSDGLDRFHIRLRSTSEQNLVRRHRAGQPTRPDRAANLERYPIFLPAPRPESYLPTHMPAANPTTQVRRAIATTADADNQDSATVRAITAGPSHFSRSSPNLLAAPSGGPVIGERNSSLSWNQQRFSADARNSRNPTRFSDAPLGSHVAETEHVDLQMRQSPLDELRDNTSRMLAARPYSQLHRAPNAPSLLAGNPFQIAQEDRVVSPPRPRNGRSTIPAIDEAREDSNGQVGRQVTAPGSVNSNIIRRNDPAARGTHETRQEFLSSSDEEDEEQVTSSPVVSFTEGLSVGVGRTPTGIYADQHPSPSTPSTMGSSPPAEQLQRPSRRAASTRPAANTPLIRIFDDRQLPSTQPRTAADLQPVRARADTVTGRSEAEHAAGLGGSWAGDVLDAGSENSLDGHESGLERDRRT